MAIFGLLDINNFYASTEILFNPKLRGKPLLILSNNDGCAVSRSDEAKALGIKMGAPWFQVQQQYKRGEVRVLSSNYALYADASDRMTALVAEYVPHWEKYSIDELFFQLDGLEHRDVTAYARTLKADALKKVGLPVCVGIAPTKTLAKLANFIAKKRPSYAGVCNFMVMSAKEINELMQGVPVGEVWGIGSRLSSRLNTVGIQTVYDLKTAHTRTLRDNFSVVMAKTISELNGNPCLDLEEIAPPRKNIASTRSFGIPVTDYQDLSESVTLYASRAAEKARSQDSYANSMSVFIQTSPFANRPYYGNSLTAALPCPSHDTRLLVKTALWLLKRLYRPGYIYQKAGVILNDLVPKAGLQRDLFFDEADTQLDKRARVIRTLDEINHRFGRQTVRLASQGFKAPWKMKQNFKSSDYTTDWNGLIQAS